jgi:hypothetical protein
MIVDDDGDLVADEAKKFACTSGEPTNIKFSVLYKGPKNCRDSKVPAGPSPSKGDLFVTATADVSHNDKLKIYCSE